MEARYLFKAKRVDNGEWVQGALVYDDRDKLYRIIIEIRYSTGTCLTTDNAPRVDASTICQCTGLRDKHGKLIWENDIVKINSSKANALITFRDFEIICIIPSEKYYKHRLEYDMEYEVVGNIFGNPELLESEG